MLPIFSTVCVVMSGFQTPRGPIEQIFGFMKVNLTNGPVFARDYTVKCLLFIINICLDCLFIDIKVKILFFRIQTLVIRNGAIKQFLNTR